LGVDHISIENIAITGAGVMGNGNAPFVKQEKASIAMTASRICLFLKGGSI
jgi:hypothetical protein